MKMAALLCVLFASSCVQRVWVKSGASDSEFQQDFAEAQYNAEFGTVGMNQSYSSPFLNSAQRTGEDIGNAMNRALQKRRLINMYLEMKGWRLEKDSLPAKTTFQKKGGRSNSSTGNDGTQYLEGPNEEVDEG